jgi:hypothetical protein
MNNFMDLPLDDIKNKKSLMVKYKILNLKN